MTGLDAIVKVAREWTAKADNDLKTATHTLTLGEDTPTDTVCFHAQQCVAKYIKALLVLKQVPFPKTHNLIELVNLLPVEFHSLLSKDEQKLLTVYATITRYPGDYEDISLSEARSAVSVARRVRKAIRGVISSMSQSSTRTKKRKK